MNRSWVLHPFNHLGRCDDVDIIHLQQLVDEAVKSVDVMFGVEPSGVDENAKWSAVGVVITEEVATEEFKSFFGITSGSATVGHSARVTINSVPTLDRDLPEAGVLVLWAGAVLTVVLSGDKVKGEGPDWFAAFPDSPGEHRSIVSEFTIVKGLVHIVAAKLKEGDTETLDAFLGHASLLGEGSLHADDLIVVFSVRGCGPPGVGESVGQGVTGDLNTHGVQGIHQVVVGAGAADVETTTDRATVGVVSAGTEQTLEVAVVGGGDLVVEGDHDHLGGALGGEAVGDAGAGTVAARELTVVGATF